MGKISIFNLQSQDSKSSLISLENEESELVKTAVKRSLDARQITGGGCNSMATCGRRPPIEFSQMEF